MTSITINHSGHRTSDASGGSIRRYALWTAQVLLALTFVVAGASKLIMSGEEMTKDINLSVTFLRFIGVCELLGAVGLVAPGALRIRRGLTPLAAACLVIIMIGATSITVATSGVAPALFPFAVGLAAAWVAYSRRSWFTEA